MSRGLWFVTGAGAGVYAMVRGRRVAEALTVDGLTDRINALRLGVRLVREEVATGYAERETQLRGRPGLAPHGLEGSRQARPPGARLAVVPGFRQAQPPTDLAQPPTDLARSPTDLAQPPTDLAQPPTDLAQPPTDLAQPPTDLAQPPTDLAQRPTDLAQPSTDHEETRP